MLILIEERPEEDLSEDLEEMEQEPEWEMEYEAYKFVGDVTPIEEEEPVASLPHVSYYLGLRIPRNWKNAHWILC